MTKRLHSNWLQAYAQHTQYSESPTLFHFWTGVATVAGALRRRVWIEQRYFQWTPNFYIIFVGPPGVAAKSTSISIGTDLLHQVPNIHFGPQSMTWQGLTASLSEAFEMVPFGDIFLPMSCITCYINELGTFLRPQDEELVNVLTSLWDGQLGVWDRKLKTQDDTKIENPWIHVIGCTTPSWLKRNVPEEMISGGLTSRMVFVYGDKKRHLIAYPAEVIDKDWFADSAEKLVHDLAIIAELCGEYKLTSKALVWGRAWYASLWANRPEHMISERYDGYITRKQTHVHKLAMVFAAAQRNELVITETDLDLSCKMITGLEASMSKVFQSVGTADISRQVNEILAYVRAYTEIKMQTLWRHMLPIMSPREFAEACDAAIKAGYMKARSQRGGMVFYIPQEKNDDT